MQYALGKFAEIQNSNIKKIALHLIFKGAKINKIDRRFVQTPLGLTCRYGNLKLAQVLLQNKANLEVLDKLKNPILLETYSTKLVKFLISKNANLEAVNKNNKTCLILKSKLGNYEIVELLLKNNAKIEAKDEKGFTPLIMSTIWAKTNVVKLLLNKNADIKAKDNERKTALDRANYSEVLNLLLEYRTKLK